MEWNRLLSSKRIGRNKGQVRSDERSPFQIDFDRIVFSSAFRRLQDKTQVFPLAESDYVRTRLTHSLEVSCVGRSLGARVGKVICERHGLKGVHASDFGAIVAAASLAHDIGNPPFGHSGESAIRHWFNASPYINSIRRKMSTAERKDIELYEGNAEGFRVLTHLQMPDNIGGMQLTCATLGAFTKYPIESLYVGRTNGVSTRKFGFFQADKEMFKEVAEEAGLIRRNKREFHWVRHPLAFLVEAADDITYRIIDFEDGHKLGLVSYKEVEDKFRGIAGPTVTNQKLSSLREDRNKIEYMRARSFEVLITQISEFFLENENDFLTGKIELSLIKLIESKDVLDSIKKRSENGIYDSQRVIEIEAAGYEVAVGLLDLFMKSANDLAKNGNNASDYSLKYLQLLPDQFKGREKNWNNSQYLRLLNILDFFCGMTDSFAVSLFKKVRGISLPNG